MTTPIEPQHHRAHCGVVAVLAQRPDDGLGVEASLGSDPDDALDLHDGHLGAAGQAVVTHGQDQPDREDEQYEDSRPRPESDEGDPAA